MFLIKFLRYIKGYVKFGIIGGFTERFINLCGRNHIPLWDFAKNGEELTTHTTVKSYKKIRPYVKRTGVRLKIKEKHGLPFIINKYRKRNGILAGAVICILFIGFMSNFIWNIEINGNVIVENEIILSSLSKSGVKIGTFKRSIDTRQVERQMVVDINELSWAAVNIKGSSAIVEVKERTAAPEQIDLDKMPANIIASDSGQIKYLEVYDGQPLVKVGDTVMAGDIIVSGITEDKKGNTMIKQARAKVMAYVPMDITSEVDIEETIKIATGENKKQYNINLFGIELSLPMYGEKQGLYDVTAKSSKAKIMGKEIPISLETNEYSYYYEEKVMLTQEQAKEKAVTEILLREQKIIGENKIIEKKATGHEKNGKFIINAQYIVEKDIAKLENILTFG